KMFKVFSRPKVKMEHMLDLEPVSGFVEENALDREVLEQTEIQVKYSGYIEKEKKNADKLHRLEDVKIPENFDYSKLKSLSYEAREKLTAVQPVTIAQAGRVSGVNPSDISVLLVYLGR
ncbi:MAG TPA: tRNA uridine-5-carboxymethylaminomethyl(34) synthesis enzyme MnmG, partial [Pricia sp.]|nr:tRNA uridine-5-carboxymethylaminomethyl(34) synthesis enzyme MnmG [Pricia sp.]